MTEGCPRAVGKLSDSEIRMNVRRREKKISGRKIPRDSRIMDAERASRWQPLDGQYLKHLRIFRGEYPFYLFRRHFFKYLIFKVDEIY